MILADTSVWVRKMRGIAAFSEPLQERLRRGEIVGHALVHGELLMGDTGGRRAFLGDYRQLPWAPTVRHVDVVALVAARGLAGSGMGWMDAHLLAAALAGGHRLWTADQALARAAISLDLSWHPPA
ncbi:MAG: PIN domain-containing protein [Terriglobales bacterium]